MKTPFQVRWLILLGLLTLPLSLSCGGGGGSGGGNTGPLGLSLLSASSESGVVLPAVGLFLNERLIFEFSAPIDPTSVNEDTIQIRRRRAENQEFAIPARGTFAVAGSTVTFVPDLPTQSDLSDSGFLRDTEYQIQLPSFPSFEVVKTISGDPLGITTTTRFSTRLSDPLLSDPVPGPPAVRAIILDLNANGMFEGDGDPATVEPEEFFDISNFPFADTVPVGLSMAPLSVAFLLSEPILPETVLRDADGDGQSDRVFLMDFNRGIRLTTRVTLFQEFQPDINDFRVEIQLTPVSTLPPGTPVRPVLLSGLVDFAAPPQDLGDFEAEFQTRSGPASFSDALIESYEDRQNTDPSSSAEWNVDQSGILASGLGIGGTGADGPFIVDSGTDITLNTSDNGGFYNFTDIDIRENAIVRFTGPNPAVIACTRNATIAGTIILRGGDGESGSDFGISPRAVPGIAGPGGFRGGVGGVPGRGNGAVTDSGGQTGNSANPNPGGGGGAGHNRPGATSFPTNCNAGRGGGAYGGATIRPLFAGSGGGGGGDLGGSPPAGGGAGGSGGGAMSINCAGLLTLTGSIDASGGEGGGGGLIPAGNLGGAGGGGGSGGAIRITSFTISDLDQDQTTILAQGGQGGQGGANPRSGGAGGAEGRIYFESFDSNRDGQPNDFVIDRDTINIAPREARGILAENELGKTFGLSKFLDTGTTNARFSFDGSDPDTGEIRFGPSIQDVSIPDGIPGTATAFIFFEAADADASDPTKPDMATATGFTSRIDSLDGFQFIRYRMDFDIGSQINSAEKINIDELRIRFEFDI